MDFDKREQTNNVALQIGFLAAYFLFTTILFFVTRSLGKFPKANYFSFMLVTSAITYLGLLLNKLYA